MPKQSFEDALEKLEEIVEQLESGELSLEEALKKFEEGIKLSRFCQRKLNDTEQKITTLLDEAQKENPTE
ncbi:MAG: exodeoxyribonuclease VII small subunit [Desulfobacterales bacterium]